MSVLFAGIDRTSRFAVTGARRQSRQKDSLGIPVAYARSRALTWVHTILTDRAIEGTIGSSPMARGIQFAEQPRNRNTISSRPMRSHMICEVEPWLRHRFGKPWQGGIAHRLAKPNHPWTNGQVERVNRTIRDATVKRFHYETHDQLRTHLRDFMGACNFARRLKTLGGLTPYEYICRIGTSEPDRFIPNPIHQMPGLNT